MEILAILVAFVCILGLLGGVGISYGIKSKKINDNLVKLQDCQIGVKDGEFSIANRLGVTNGEETNLTAQHKILREDHKDIKIILNEEIKKQKEQLLQSNEYRWAQAIDDLILYKNILGEKNQLIADLYREKSELEETNKELDEVIKTQAKQIEELNAKLNPDKHVHSQDQGMYPTL